MAEEADDDLREEGEHTDAPEVEAVETDTDDQGSSSEPSPVESLARELGWKPEAEWRGPKDNWTPADEFIRSKVSKGDRLYDEVKGLKDTVQRIGRTSATIAERAIQEHRRELEERFNQAVQDGDTEAAMRASDELRRAKEPVQQADDPIAAFVSRNSWWGAHERATDLAKAKAAEVAKRGGSVEDELAAAETAVRRAFPELFEADADAEPKPRTERRQAPPVQGGQRTAQSAPRAKGFNDLPPDAKRAAQDFARRGRCTLEEYAATYYEENA